MGHTDLLNFRKKADITIYQTDLLIFRKKANLSIYAESKSLVLEGDEQFDIKAETL